MYAVPGCKANIHLRIRQCHVQLHLQDGLCELHARHASESRLQRLLPLSDSRSAQEGETSDAVISVRKQIQIDHRKY